MAESRTELSRLLNDVLSKRADDADLPRRPPPRRTPDTNNGFQPAATRGPRNRSHRDPTGEKAVGNLTPRKKKS